MTRRSRIFSLFLGLGACCLSGCLFGGGVHAPAVEKNAGAPVEATPQDGGSAYHAHEPPPLRDDKSGDGPFAQVRYPDAPPPPGGPAPSVKPEITPPPALPEPAVLHVEKAPPDPKLVAALRCLLEKRSADALELLQNYDGASRELLLTLLPLAARVGDGGLDHATPQETAVLLEQLRQLETVLRPHAALALGKVCFCRKVNGFGDCEPWPENHVFRAGAEGDRGEWVQVYAEVRNFTSRPQGASYEISLAGAGDIRDAQNRLAAHLDFPVCVKHSQTPRQDYFVNFQFYLPSPMPPGRYTLHVLVKDVLNPAAGDDASPRSAARSLDFLVGAPGDGHD